MNTGMMITLALLAICMAFFIRGRVRADLVALCAMVLLVLTGVLTPTEAFVSFSDSVVIMVIGLFIVSGGVLRTGLAKMVGSKIVQTAGDSEEKLFFLVIIVTTFIGAFVSNSGTVALMMPIVISMAAESPKINLRRILMPMAFAGSLGGMFTLIGTPPNLVIHKTLTDAGFYDIGFFSFSPVGAVVFVVGLFGFWILSKVLLSRRIADDTSKQGSKSYNELVSEYKLSNKRFMVAMKSNSPLCGKSLKELRIPEKYGISIVKVTHQKHSFFKHEVYDEIAGPYTVLGEEDSFEVLGAQTDVERFILDNKLKLTGHVKDDAGYTGVAEAVLLPSSKLVNVKIKDSGIRKTYSVNILAVNHRGEYISENLPELAMQAGDALLVEGRWENLERLDNDYKNIVLVGQPLAAAAKITLDHKAPIAGAILLGMIVVMVINLMTPMVAVAVAALLMVVTGCLRNMEEAYNLINWESVILIAAMLPMSVALQKTGAADLLAVNLVHTLGDRGVFLLLAGIYFCCSLTTMFISNTATTLIFAPIALKVALSMGVSPYPFLMAVTVAASMCFASPFSTASNVMVMTPGRYSFLDYIKVGLPMQIVIGVVMVFVLPLIFPF